VIATKSSFYLGVNHQVGTSEKKNQYELYQCFSFIRLSVFEIILFYLFFRIIKAYALIIKHIYSDFSMGQLSSNYPMIPLITLIRFIEQNTRAGVARYIRAYYVLMYYQELISNLHETHQL
jgi:hypothetical protein